MRVEEEKDKGHHRFLKFLCVFIILSLVFSGPVACGVNGVYKDEPLPDIPVSRGSPMLSILIHDLKMADTLEMRQMVVVVYFLSLSG